MMRCCLWLWWGCLVLSDTLGRVHAVTHVPSTSERLMLISNLIDKEFDCDPLPLPRNGAVDHIPRGGSWFILPPGWNPFGYCITGLGEDFLSYEGSIECDVGRFLASLKKRKRFAALKEQWLEIVRVSKSGQTMRIYRQLDELLHLCIRMRLVD